jgi:hypothetical protein
MCINLICNIIALSCNTTLMKDIDDVMTLVVIYILATMTFMLCDDSFSLHDMHNHGIVNEICYPILIE